MPSGNDVTAADLTRWRLSNQRISCPDASSRGDVVARMGAMQGQDYPGALWSVGLRVPQGTEEGVSQAVADGHIVRTWLMRGTLHLAAPADVHWMRALFAPRLVAGAARRRSELGLGDVTLERVRELFTAALHGGGCLTRAAALGVLEEAGIPTGTQRGYHILWWCALQGTLCYGPPVGKEPTFVLLDEWVPRTAELSREEAAARLAQRYFISHGPATVQDFAWWSGLTAAEARGGLEAARPNLVSVTAGSRTYWMAPAAPPASGPTVHLLPGFDEYMLGYQDRGVVVDAAHARKIVPGNNGIFMPTLVINGHVAGTWKRAVKKGSVVVTLQPFGTLTAAEKDAAAVAAGRYGEFLRLPASLA